MTPEELSLDWLRGEPFEGDLEATATAITTVERLLGRHWIDSFVDGGQGFSRGGKWILTLRMLARLGQLLVASENAARFKSSILKKLQNNPQELSSVWSELLTAEPFLLAGFPVEFAPPVKVGSTTRHPDFSIEVDGTLVFVEVTRPSASSWQREASDVMQRLIESGDVISPGHQISLALRRLPTAAEEADLLEQVCCAAAATRVGLIVPRQEVRDFAWLQVSDQADVQLPEAGAKYLAGCGIILLVSRLHFFNALAKPSVLVVGVAFQDGRAMGKLRNEAEQLPDSEPSLVIVDVSETTGIAFAWRDVARRFFNNDNPSRGHELQRKPSAVWFTGEMITPGGVVRIARPFVVTNGHAPQLPKRLRTFIEAA